MQHILVQQLTCARMQETCIFAACLKAECNAKSQSDCYIAIINKYHLHKHCFNISESIISQNSTSCKYMSFESFENAKMQSCCDFATHSKTVIHTQTQAHKWINSVNMLAMAYESIENAKTQSCCDFAHSALAADVAVSRPRVSHEYETGGRAPATSCYIAFLISTVRFASQTQHTFTNHSTMPGQTVQHHDEDVDMERGTPTDEEVRFQPCKIRHTNTTTVPYSECHSTIGGRPGSGTRRRGCRWGDRGTGCRGTQGSNRGTSLHRHRRVTNTIANNGDIYRTTVLIWKRSVQQ